MPSRKKSKIAIEERTYRATPVARQTRFGSRRKTVHRKSDISAVQLQKRQSTLTQLDFLRQPPSDSEDEEEVIVRDSEEETESEADKEVEPPRKRRKKSAAPSSSNALKQSTMTQAFPRLPPSFDLYDEDVPGVELSSGDYTELSEREDSMKNNRLDEWVTIQSAQREVDKEIGISADAKPFLNLDTSSHSAASIFSSSPARPGYDGLANSRIPMTPKRLRVFEVPSSQTPPATPLSTQQTPRGAKQENSPLERRSTSRRMFQRSPQKSQSQRSPLKEMSMNVQIFQASTQHSPLKVTSPDTQPSQVSLQPSIVPASSLRDRTPSKTIVSSPRRHTGVDVSPAEAIIEPEDESPTRRRVREFNARYAALSRQGSELRSRQIPEPIHRGKVIRSSTGFTSIHDDNTDPHGSHTLVETQYPVGEETQTIMGSIDLAYKAVGTPPNPNIALQDDGGEGNLLFSRRRRSPRLHRQQNTLGEDDLSANQVEPEMSAELLTNFRIKEEQQSIFGDKEIQDFEVRSERKVSHREEYQGPEGAQGQEQEERIPSSQQQQDQACSSQHSQIYLQQTHMKEERSQALRAMPLSQFGDGDAMDDGGSMEEASPDLASEQLLRETQAFNSWVSPTSPAAQMFPPPPIHSSPTQATTMDETQPNASHRTQDHLPGSPIRLTQSIGPLKSSHILRNTPRRLTRSILVPSSPVPIPPGDLSSSSVEASTPTTMRFLNINPITVSQLIPESLRDDGSIPQPPMWTQDEDEEDDEL